MGSPSSTEPATAAWSARLRPHLVAGMNQAALDELLAPLATDRAWVPLGGSGARALVFRLDATVDAWFQLDGAGRLVGFAVSERRGAWDKAPNGVLRGSAAVPPLLTLIRT